MCVAPIATIVHGGIHIGEAIVNPMTRNGDSENANTHQGISKKTRAYLWCRLSDWFIDPEEVKSVS